MLKISVIGAGSGTFSIPLTRDLCHINSMQDCIISLMDINEERLDSVYNICVRLNSELGGSLKFEKTTDRAVSLEGADFVITTALTASYDRLRDGWEIAEKYGFRFGGSYHIMYDEAFWINFYQFRFFEELTLDILKYCPDAWHLLIANPVISGVTLLQRKYPQVKMLGLCHGYSLAHDIPTYFELGKNDITYQMPGVNHFIWMNECHLGGKPFFPFLDKWISEKADDLWGKEYVPSALDKKRMDFYKKHGVIGVGDTMGWSGASWPWWYHTDEKVEKEFCIRSPKDDWEELCFSVARNNTKYLHDLASDPDAKMTDHFPYNGPDIMSIVPIIESIVCDIPGVFIVNVLNKGFLVPGIPEDFEVEVPALCSAAGVHPITTSPLPKTIIAHTLRDRVAPVEMELAAYENGSLDYLKELVLMDKWATSMKQVSDFVDEILDLPYHKAMKEHYR
ncbi:MAG: hypothetical protein IJ457_08875 [Clostridia bacterium]|nr:hypothetical protein [Clostridia bacterium]